MAARWIKSHSTTSEPGQSAPTDPSRKITTGLIIVFIKRGLCAACWIKLLVCLRDVSAERCSLSAVPNDICVRFYDIITQIKPNFNAFLEQTEQASVINVNTCTCLQTNMDWSRIFLQIKTNYIFFFDTFWLLDFTNILDFVCLDSSRKQSYTILKL